MSHSATRSSPVGPGVQTSASCSVVGKLWHQKVPGDRPCLPSSLSLVAPSEGWVGSSIHTWNSSPSSGRRWPLCTAPPLPLVMLAPGGLPCPAGCPGTSPSPPVHAGSHQARAHLQRSRIHGDPPRHIRAARTPLPPLSRGTRRSMSTRLPSSTLQTHRINPIAEGFWGTESAQSSTA